MKITYHDQKHSLNIEDGLKTTYFMLKTALGLNLVVPIIQFVRASQNGFDFQSVLWVFIGSFSIALFIYFQCRKTSRSSFYIEEIERLTETKILGKKQYALLLKNGKKRDLIDVKTQADYEKLIAKLQNLDIPLS